MNNFTANASIIINVTPARVWEALTDPALVKQYLFGTNLTADWKKGGTIFYKGVWEGKEYEDKGIILDIVPEKLLVTNYWSGFSGLPDAPENYQKVSYIIKEKDGGTELSIIQENNESEEKTKHSEGNWNMVLGEMKKLLEK